MMTSNELLDALKARSGAASDYALARQVLKIEQNSLKEIRARGLSDERAFQVATLLDLDPAEVMAWVRAERTKDPKVKKVWEGVAKSLKSAAAGIAAVAAAWLAMRYGVDSDAGTALLAGFTGNIHYAQLAGLGLLAVILGGLVAFLGFVLGPKRAALALLLVGPLVHSTGYALISMG